ncbi:hypothetical protein M514_23699 [Trichuris suis]|uniref:Uncharacterized protein n=1 Tax=Trichuris suis TaxID=68888 RepID=A0A085N3S2_9BILA|nr:hypothetical protein M514_23699 [Trichuris suis]
MMQSHSFAEYVYLSVLVVVRQRCEDVLSCITKAFEAFQIHPERSLVAHDEIPLRTQYKILSHLLKTTGNQPRSTKLCDSSDPLLLTKF